MSGDKVGPTVRPGDLAPRWESLNYGVTADSTVLAVVQGEGKRFVLFYLAAGTEHTLPHVNDRGKKRQPKPKAHVGYGWWEHRTDGREAWGVAMWRPWEGPQTLEETIQDVCERSGCSEVLRPVDDAAMLALVAAEERRPIVVVVRPLPWGA